MKLATSFLVLWLSVGGALAQSDAGPEAEESYSDWGLRHLRGSFESVNGYFDSFMELLGGKNGICQYRCRYGEWVACLPARLSPGPCSVPTCPVLSHHRPHWGVGLEWGRKCRLPSEISS